MRSSLKILQFLVVIYKCSITATIVKIYKRIGASAIISIASAVARITRVSTTSIKVHNVILYLFSMNTQAVFNSYYENCLVIVFVLKCVRLKRKEE